MHRPLRVILALPLNGREERLADRHIRLECDRIRSTWTPHELHQRAGLPAVAWMPPEVHHVADPVDDEPPGA